MNFVTPGPIDPLALILIGIGVILVLLGIWIVPRTKGVFGEILAVGVAVFGVAGFIAFGLAYLWDSPNMHQRLELGSQIEDSYGLKLSGEELIDLNYPSSKPKDDFEVFGSVFDDQRTEDGFERKEIFLIWQDGKMALAASTDGETFTELQR